MLDKPACPSCGHRVPQVELEKAQREMEEIEEQLFGRREQDQERTLTLLLQAVSYELLNVSPGTRVALASGYLDTQEVTYSRHVLEEVVADMVAKSKVCPKCDRRWPEDQLLMKCVSCEEVFCPACKSLPNVHKFECPVWRARPRT